MSYLPFLMGPKGSRCRPAWFHHRYYGPRAGKLTPCARTSALAGESIRRTHGLLFLLGLWIPYDVHPRLRRRGMDLVVGGKFPDLALPDHTGKVVRLSEINEGKDPLAVIFYRGWW